MYAQPVAKRRRRWDRPDRLPPTNTQAAGLSSVCGRLLYGADIGRFSGSAVHLDAQNPNIPLSWSPSISPDAARELDRLREDGHEIRREGRHWLIANDIESIRTTQLYRTLPHEIGHYVDYQRSYLNALPDDVDYDEALSDAYDAKPVHDKEAFAHRYADEARARLAQEGRIPFVRIMNESWARTAGLDPRWFYATPASRPRLSTSDT